MAVTVTDNRTEVDDADALTGWSNPLGGSAPELTTSEPDPIENTGCIGAPVSTEDADIVFGITSTDLSDTLIYVWILANGTMNTTALGGIGITLGDGTDRVAYHLAGSDAAGFRHSTGPVGWQCLLIDTSTPPASFTTLAGSEANLTFTALTQVGSYFETLSKSLGGGTNCYTDIIRYGNGGLTITAGTSGDPGLFSEIVTEDLSSAAGGALGILRELGTGLYGLQGPLTFGDSAGTAATFFADTNAVVAFEDRGINTDKYSITVQGNSTGSTTFRLGLIAGTDGGSDGVTLLCPTGVGASFVASDTDLQALELYACTLAGFENGVTFSTDATNAPNHDVFATTFRGCGEIAPGLVDFRNNIIVGAVLGSNLEGAVLLPTSTTNFVNNSFQIGVEGHAIAIESGTAYTLSGITYVGYSASTSGATFHTQSGVDPSGEVITTDAAHGFVTGEPFILNDDGGTDTVGLTEGTTYYARALTTTTLSAHTSAADAESDTARVNLSDGSTGETQSLYSGNAAILNNTGGALTLSISAGDTPSIRNVGASTTTVENNVAVTLTGLVNPTEVRVYAEGTTTELVGQEDVTTGTYVFSRPAGEDVDIRIFAVSYEPADILNFTIPNDPATIPIQQRFDRNYSNP